MNHEEALAEIVAKALDDLMQDGGLFYNAEARGSTVFVTYEPPAGPDIDLSLQIGIEQ